MKITKQGKDISSLAKEELNPGDEILSGDNVFILQKSGDNDLYFSVESEDFETSCYLKFGRPYGVAWNEKGEFISPKVCWHVRSIMQVNKKAVIKVYEE